MQQEIGRPRRNHAAEKINKHAIDCNSVQYDCYFKQQSVQIWTAEVLHVRVALTPAHVEFLKHLSGHRMTYAAAASDGGACIWQMYNKLVTSIAARLRC